MPENCFTPRSARKLLREIRPFAERVREVYRALESRRPRRIACDARVDPIYFRLLLDLRRALSEIGRCGARVRDPREGVVDFPARRAGRAVLLCWKVGEPTLEFWNEPDADWTARRRVDEDGPWEDQGAGKRSG
jgi:hypothetical protein